MSDKKGFPIAEAAGEINRILNRFEGIDDQGNPIEEGEKLTIDSPTINNAILIVSDAIDGKLENGSKELWAQVARYFRVVEKDEEQASYYDKRAELSKLYRNAKQAGVEGNFWLSLEIRKEIQSHQPDNLEAMVYLLSSFINCKKRHQVPRSDHLAFTRHC